MSGGGETDGGAGVNEMVGTVRTGTGSGRFGDGYLYGRVGVRVRQIHTEGVGGEEGRVG